MTIDSSARAAAMTFSLMPPTGSTRPRRLISPVIAVSLSDGAPGQQRDERGEHRDPGRGAVLRDRAGRDVDVDVARLEQLRVDAEPDRAALDQRQRRLRALAHHLAELAGQDEAALAGNAGRLDEQDVAADRRPGEPGRDPGDAGAHLDLALEPARSEHLVQVGGGRSSRARRCPRRSSSRRCAAPCRSRVRGCAPRLRACSRG